MLTDTGSVRKLRGMETTHLGSRHVNRSAYAYDTAIPSTIYLGICAEHNRPVRHDARGGGKFEQIPCPVTGHMIRGERLVAVVTNLDCDGACRSARKSNCACGCGGVNHGNTWTAGALVSQRETVESEIDKSRAEIAKVGDRRQQRREATVLRERSTFDRWAADHQDVIQALAPWRDKRDENDFLHSMAIQVIGGWNGKPKPLTENQEAAVLRIIADIARRAQVEAERKAAAKPAPQGKAQVAGEIVKITCREGYMSGSAETKATVQCDGYAVWVTLPRPVEQWAVAHRSRQIWGNRVNYGRPDYEGAGYRWTAALKGTRVSFTADLTRSDKDASFAFAKRPSKVTFTPPAD